MIEKEISEQDALIEEHESIEKDLEIATEELIETAPDQCYHCHAPASALIVCGERASERDYKCKEGCGRVFAWNYTTNSAVGEFD